MEIRKRKRRLMAAAWVLTTLLALTGCDGTGGTADNSINATVRVFTRELQLNVEDTVRIEAETISDAVIEFATQDASVAVVDSTGLVTATGVGRTNIVVSVPKTALCEASEQLVMVAVSKGQATLTMSSSPFTMHVGQQVRRIATTEGSGVISYTSSDEGVATVDETGMVTGRGEGSCVITARIVSEHYIISPDSLSYQLTVRGFARTQLTQQHLGALVCRDGYVYLRKADASMAGVKIVGRVAYVGSEADCENGLAVAMEDAYSTPQTWAIANAKSKNWSSNSGNTVSFGKWRLPTVDDFQLMTETLGSIYVLTTLPDNRFIEDNYWTSTAAEENGQHRAYSLKNGRVSDLPNATPCYIRYILAF